MTTAAAACHIDEYRRLIALGHEADLATAAKTTLQPISECAEDTEARQPGGDERSLSTSEDTDNTERPPSRGSGGSESEPEPEPEPDGLPNGSQRSKRSVRGLSLNKYEESLLAGVVDTTNIGANYSDIHVHPSVIGKLERVTALTLKRPEAFSYGVLHANRVTGVLLYGPPGTGKTLLAKSLAKQSGFTMITITAADLFQEDVRVIRAAFSLARKLYPAILFIDEADSIFGARKGSDKKYVRGMRNQFLQEWDGMGSDKRSGFLLLATNRLPDLDPAVLRRAPVHIQLKIPTIHARRAILRVLLKDELLGPGVDFDTLVKLTPGYTGSDLKSLCVTTALASMSEETRDPVTGKYPPQRIIQRKHFQQAMGSIRATSSAASINMTSRTHSDPNAHDNGKWKTDNELGKR